MSHPLEHALAVAQELARQAGQVVAGYFRTDLGVDRKAGDEPVTAADRESQALIIAGLRREFPEDGVLAEESDDRTSWTGHRRTWVIDPLDGTKDFIAGRVGFSVMVGLLERGASAGGEQGRFRPVLGVVFQPVRDLVYRAVAGQGAELVDGDRRAPLRVSDHRELAALRLVASKSHRGESIDAVKRATGITDEENVGSVGLKIGLIARAERDLYVNPEGHCKLWDTCAPQVILTEAGGRMTDIHGDPLRYDDPAQIRLARGVLASNGACHEAVLEKIAPLFPRR